MSYVSHSHRQTDRQTKDTEIQKHRDTHTGTHTQSPTHWISNDTSCVLLYLYCLQSPHHITMATLTSRVFNQIIMNLPTEQTTSLIITRSSSNSKPRFQKNTPICKFLDQSGNLKTIQRQSEDNLETIWRQSGDNLVTIW